MRSTVDVYVTGTKITNVTNALAGCRLPLWNLRGEPTPQINFRVQILDFRLGSST